MANWKALTANLSGISDRVTLSWTELHSIVGGLPASATKHRAWWSGDRSHIHSWRSVGFVVTDLQMGSRVTFSRNKNFSSVKVSNSLVAPIKSEPLAHEQPRVEDSIPDILLISCVKSKQSVAAPAKDLYTSPLFRKARTYAEQRGAPWFILSAEHGLVTPSQRLAPYEKYLPDESSTYREEWGKRVVAELEMTQGSLRGKVIEIHAGSAYLNVIRSGLESSGAIILEPLHGLPMGKRLQWYDIYFHSHNSEETSEAEITLPNIPELVAELSDPSNSIPPAEFLNGGSSGRKLPGLYSWWVDSDGAIDLTNGIGFPIEAGMIYAGLAGATHWPSGKKSTNTLWLRIATMHLGMNHEFSTFRRTIGAILAITSGAREIDEVALTLWMGSHLRVIAIPYGDADSLGRAEEAVLAQLDPPLNLKGMAKTDLRRHLKELRKAVVH